MGAGLPHALEGGADVQVGATGARASVEAERAPFVTGPVVRGEDDERVLQFAMLLEVGEQPPDALVDVLDHRGEGGHASREVLTAVGRKAVP